MFDQYVAPSRRHADLIIPWSRWACSSACTPVPVPWARHVLVCHSCLHMHLQGRELGGNRPHHPAHSHEAAAARLTQDLPQPGGHSVKLPDQGHAHHRARSRDQQDRLCILFRSPPAAGEHRCWQLLAVPRSFAVDSMHNGSLSVFIWLRDQVWTVCQAERARHPACRQT